jgi:hypothetical protein
MTTADDRETNAVRSTCKQSEHYLQLSLAAHCPAISLLIDWDESDKHIITEMLN